MVFNELAESGLAPDERGGGRADYVVAYWEKAGGLGRREGRGGEDVPDFVGQGERGVLEGEGEGGGGRGRGRRWGGRDV